MKKKILCIQISTNLINGEPDNNDLSTKYYETLYQVKEHDGYYKGKHFWEIPNWVAIMDYNIPVDFHICTDIETTVRFLLSNDYDYVCFSVLDVNKNIIKEIITKYQSRTEKQRLNICRTYEESKFILGGYINFENYLKDFDSHNIIAFNTIEEFIKDYLGLDYKLGYDYRLFKGYKVIPRLALSTGCQNRCDFCTVEKKITIILMDIIEQQVNAFKDLDFKLVYINDKTFGQCHNFIVLPKLYDEIKKYNSNFEGFIIQTTTGRLLKFSDAFLKDSHIKYIELGIESMNDSVLKKYHKANSELLTKRAFLKIYNLNKDYFDMGVFNYNSQGIKLIPNIIIGMPEENMETYGRTLHFMMMNESIISHFNIYNLAVYEEAVLSNRLEINNDNQNENMLLKSFHKDTEPHKWFFEQIYKLGISQLMKQKLRY